MIWHVNADEFIRFLKDKGFEEVGQTDRHDLYERSSDRVQVRRSSTLTQAEVDAICDAVDLDPPKMDSFFGQ